MDYIKQILSKDSNLEELLMCFEVIKDNKDVAVIKFDGERVNNSYTLMVMFSNQSRQMLRIDSNNLKEGMQNILKEYIAE